MPLVSRWGSKVTSVPAIEPKANDPKPITLVSRPIPVDLDPKAESLGSQAGKPIPVKFEPVQPPISGPVDLSATVQPPISGPVDLSAVVQS